MNNEKINEKEFKQLCRLLQIQTDVTIHDLRKAYYRLARNCHPDKNANNELATKHFILISRAYHTLYNHLHYKNRNYSSKCFENSYQNNKKSSIVEQFLSDLQRQDVEWPRSSKLYNENDYTYSPIEKLLNHLLQATVINETSSKKFTSEQRQNLNSNRYNTQTSQAGNTTSSSHNQSKQQPEMHIPSSTEKAIIPYRNDMKYYDFHNQSDHVLQRKSQDLNEWIIEAQTILDNIKSSRKLSRLSLTSCLNSRRNSEVENLNLIPVIDNPDMMRCLVCYRTFKTDVATKHVEICTRKSQMNKSNGTKSLGSTVSTGYSPATFRAKQYAEDLHKRRASHNPTNMSSNYQSSKQ
ncbi:hypothetical protein KSF78_0008845 [Schistosoma japonicum]|uniref:Hypotheticial protein n=1 Tax=Schistosoma japonicum TaxID=6182 RepID=C7TY37_SCHJA|nr:hypothetical protein KSF78_0008845 [Schistosoma japonicum]CAX82513.1 hypotheticial protein [Schistosoma japonicum]